MLEHTFAIVVYKDSEFLESCINSILNQTIKSKILICTSTPTDFNKSISIKYNIDFIVNPNGNNGIGSDWNFALQQVKTKFSTIAHQDDLYEKEFTEIVVNKIKRNEEKCLIVFTNYFEIIKNKKRGFSILIFIKTLLLAPFLIKPTIQCKFLKKISLSFGDPICCPSVTFNLQNLSNFNFSEKYHFILDWDAWFKLAKENGSFIYVNKKLMLHRIHGKSETSKLIESGIRIEEERTMLRMIWGNKLGVFLSFFYKFGYLGNKK